MGTKVGIVYAAVSGIVRRYIYPTDDAELGQPWHVGKGEAMLVVDQKVITSPLDIYVELSAHLGKVIPDPTCAVVDKLGNVVGMVMADPDLDTIDNHTLLLSKAAAVGDTVVGGVLVKAVAAVDLPA
jgi:hypothetical protein